MSNISPALTTQVASGSQQALQGSKTGVLSAGLGSGLNFIDLIVARLSSPEAMGPAVKTAQPSVTVLPAAQPKAAVGANPLAALQVALSSQALDPDGNIVLTPAAAKTGDIQKQLEFTNQIINHLKTMLPEGAETEGVFSRLLGKLQAKSETLQASLSALEANDVIAKDMPASDIPMPLMIALGLKPSEIADVTMKIDELEKQLGRDITVEDLIAGVGGIMPPAPEAATVAFTANAGRQVQLGAAGSADAVIDAATSDGALPSDDLAAQLNALDVGGEASGNAAKPAGLPEGKMEGLPVIEDGGAAVKPDAAADATVKKTGAEFKDQIASLLNTNKSAAGEMVFPLHLFGGDAEAAIYQQYGLQPAAATSLGSAAQASNIVATPASAGQAHPATNMVSAQIAKFASTGGDQTLNIRLDPPELGNLTVRLSIGKDKSVKAHMTVEKPETYLMLQRDAQSLERALQQAGLEPGTEAISFELAQDNGAFAHDNNGEGAKNNAPHGRSGMKNAEEMEVIQSSVTWQVDPSTGHVRYNIFA